jgi:hypothetical protein
MIIIKGMTVKDKKKKIRGGLFSTKLSWNDTQTVLDLGEETGLHPAHIIRGLVSLAISTSVHCPIEELGQIVAVRGALNKKAA